ncbi:MAG TPA: hypothetical protein VFS76_14010 [Pyrinomonadaceae bacterium]|nr:hypothetical protein [Pyrinomonadaceae bacterium]
MADDNTGKAQPGALSEVSKINFVGIDQVASLYADSFIVASTGEMFILHFFQNSPPSIAGAELDKTSTREATQAKCFAKIVVSPNGFVKLLTAMAGQAGLVISKPEQEAQ